MNQIQHVVVLMLENRSFDHILGYLRHPDRTFKGLRNGAFTNPDAAGTPVPTTPSADGRLPFDPHHGHGHVTRQLTDVPWSEQTPLKKENVTLQGFVRDAEADHGPPARRIMECFDQSDIPVLAQLALEYAVADQWFCSVPGPTWPNRNFAHAATSDGRINNRPYKLYGNKTIYEVLESARATWRVYHDGFPQVAIFWKLLLGNSGANFQSMDDFRVAVELNALPNYAFIEPRHASGTSNSQHPMNNEHSARDFYAGEALIAHVYNTLASNPVVWRKTLLVITYDEHGGFPDHEIPHDTVPPKRGMSTLGFKWNMTGVRVPAVLVSPWIRRGVVDHTFYDHASIVKSVRARFAPRARKLSNRDEQANSWWDAPIWLDTMRTDVPAVAPRMAIEETVAAQPELEAAEAPSEDEEDLAWLALEIDRLLDAKAEGVPLEAAVAAREATREAVALEAAPPPVRTRAEVVALTDRVAARLR